MPRDRDTVHIGRLADRIMERLAERHLSGLTESGAGRLDGLQTLKRYRLGKFGGCRNHARPPLRRDRVSLRPLARVLVLGANRVGKSPLRRPERNDSVE